MSTILETGRLILREYTVEDAADFFRLNSDPEVMRYVPDQPMTGIEEARQILLSHPIADYTEHGYGRCACILKATGENIGFCGLKYLKELSEVDLGFRFLPEHWAKGLASEAAQACVGYGFTRLGLNEIIGLSHPDNGGSIRVLEKAGLQFTGIVSPYGWAMRKYLIRKEAGSG